MSLRGHCQPAGGQGPHPTSAVWQPSPSFLTLSSARYLHEFCCFCCLESLGLVFLGKEKRLLSVLLLRTQQSGQGWAVPRSKLGNQLSLHRVVQHPSCQACRHKGHGVSMQALGSWGHPVGTKVTRSACRHQAHRVSSTAFRNKRQEEAWKFVLLGEHEHLK